jgi:hypothetical protein
MAIPNKRLMPTGECWCGCGEETPVGAFFKPGHDRRSEAMLIKLLYGSVAGFLDAYGFKPGGRNLKDEYEKETGKGDK